MQKKLSNINTMEPLAFDKDICPEDEVQSIYFTVTPPAKKIT